MITEAEILYEVGNFYVAAAVFGSGRFKPKSHGYQVFENGVTAAKCVAIIGYSGDDGLRRAKAEADRRNQQP